MLSEAVPTEVAAAEQLHKQPDPVTAAQASLDAAHEREAKAQAAVADAQAVILHAEESLQAEEQRLTDHDNAVTEAVLARQPIPVTSPSAVSAIDDAITIAKAHLRAAQTELGYARDAVREAETSVRSARNQQAADELAAIVLAHPRLLELARSIGGGSFAAESCHIERVCAGYVPDGLMSTKKQAGTCTITIALEPRPT